MEDRVDAVGEEVAQLHAIGKVAGHQDGAVRDRGSVAAGQVVVDDDLVSALDEALDTRGSDVAGATDRENLQSASSRLYRASAAAGSAVTVRARLGVS